MFDGMHNTLLVLFSTSTKRSLSIERVYTNNKENKRRGKRVKFNNKHNII